MTPEQLSVDRVTESVDRQLAIELVGLDEFIQRAVKAWVGQDTYDAVQTLRALDRDLADCENPSLGEIDFGLAFDHVASGGSIDEAIDRANLSAVYSGEDAVEEAFDEAHEAATDYIQGLLNERLDGYELSNVSDGMLHVKRVLMTGVELHVVFVASLKDRHIQEATAWLELLTGSPDGLGQTVTMQDLKPSEYSQYGLDVDSLRRRLLGALQATRPLLESRF